MKHWTVTDGIWGLRWEAKVIYTVFLAFSLLGYGVMGVMMATRTGFTPDSIAAYYAGNEAAGIYAKTVGELLEVTHYHLFAIPLFLFVLGHVFLLCAGPSHRVKILALVAAFLGAALHIVAPWLIVYVTPILSPLVLVARVLLGGSLLLFIVAPLREMWTKSPAKPTAP